MTGRCHFANQGRSGYTLVFFAMLIFNLMGMAALVIDLGFARLTQRQMQTAVDSAALEGLRGEGNINYSDRQNAAKFMATLHFDDDLIPAADDGAFDSGSGQFGAGTLVDFAGGAGDPSLVTSQTMSVDPDNPVYKPEFVDGVESATGFQAAMLRGGTADPAADVFSAGPSVLYLFARGSLINRQLIQAGLTVRATGIANARPAVAVGVNSVAKRLSSSWFNQVCQTRINASFSDRWIRLAFVALKLRVFTTACSVGKAVVRTVIKTVAGMWEQARGILVAVAASVAEVSFDV